MQYALTVPNGNDKLVQEVAKIILERIYEPIFSEYSHGFRPEKSCHTALMQVKQSWTGVKWIIEMDIKGFFDNLSHEVLLRLLNDKIQDKRFISLIEKMLKAGYLEDWKYNESYSGTVQGGNISPILSNIYLDCLDKYMEKSISKFYSGKSRKENPEYAKNRGAIERLRRKYKKINEDTSIANKSEMLNEIKNSIKELKMERLNISSIDPFDENYKRIRYSRYADDFIIGIIGSKEEAMEVAKNIKIFLLKTLELNIAEDKFKIVQASKGVPYLGYIVKSYTGNKIIKTKVAGTYTHKRTIVDRIQLIIPKEKLQIFCKNKGYGDFCTAKPMSRPNILHGSDAEIIATYNAELRGLANYYSIAINAKKCLGNIINLGRRSCAMTLANKHKISTNKMIKSMKCSNGEWIRTIETANKTYQFRIYRLKTDFTETVFSYQKLDSIPNVIRFTYSRTELIQKLEANKCEICGSDKNVQVHHIRKMKDIKDGKEVWQIMMIARNRKTLVLCSDCHNKLHAGKLQSHPQLDNN